MLRKARTIGKERLDNKNVTKNEMTKFDLRYTFTWLSSYVNAIQGRRESLECPSLSLMWHTTHWYQIPLFILVFGTVTLIGSTIVIVIKRCSLGNDPTIWKCTATCNCHRMKTYLSISTTSLLFRQYFSHEY